MALALFQHGDCTNALAEAQELLAAEPQNLDALLVKGLALAETARYREAIPPLTEVLALQRTNYLARLYRARSHWNLDELDAAQQDYEVITETSSEDYRAYFALADIASRKRDARSAVRNCELFLRCAPPGHSGRQFVQQLLKTLKPD